jgi:hypothetical protein
MVRRFTGGGTVIVDKSTIFVSLIMNVTRYYNFYIWVNFNHIPFIFYSRHPILILNLIQGTLWNGLKFFINQYLKDWILLKKYLSLFIHIICILIILLTDMMLKLVWITREWLHIWASKNWWKCPRFHKLLYIFLFVWIS